MYREVKASWKKFWASLALLSVDLLILLVAFTVSFIVFIWIAKYIFLDDKTAFDDRAFNYLRGWVSNTHTEIMEAFTFLGKYQFLLPAQVLLTAWFLFVRKHRWYSIKVPVIGITSALVMLFLKDIFQRPRPLSPLLNPVAGLSFPSGHAFCSMTFFGLLIYFTWKHWKNAWARYIIAVILLFTVFMIGLSRVYLRVHHASDVLAGFCLGLIWLVISMRILRIIEKQAQKKAVSIVGPGSAPTVETAIENAAFPSPSENSSRHLGRD